MPSHRSRRSLDSGRRPSRPLAHERLEPRLALTAAQGLVAVGAQPEGALSGKIVYTSAGHGWQWSDTLNRFATDRGNLLSLVEDFGNQDQLTFYVDHLFRAGATVVPMRPVGHQPNEVVLDNDSADVVWSGSWLTSTSGTRWYDEDYGRVADTARYRYANVSGSAETATAVYAPAIPAAGFYPVYAWASTGSNRTDQLYRVNHTGGSTQVRIDHRTVGSGWIYLGTYHFDAGRSPAEGSVTVSNFSTAGGSVVIADAIRFGNGMGDVPSGPNGIGTGTVSGYPREDENSLHWLWRSVGQGTAFTSPSSIIGTDNVSAPSKMAAEMNADTNAYGTSVYVGFHSNATTGNPSTATARGAIGLVHSTNPTPNQSNLATVLAKQINVDMRAVDGQFEYDWSTRTTYALAGAYGEISNLRAGDEFDSTIIEVGFHDNTPDNALLRDAGARDQIARSTYEGTLEHLINQPGTTAPPPNITLPSPPTQVSVTCTADGAATISWVSGPSSSGGVAGVFGSPATGFRVFGATDGVGFDGGRVVVGGNARSLTISGLDPSRPYQFRVAATNGGGESLPSEVVTVLPAVGPRQVLIVNGFDRIDKSQNFKATYLTTGVTTERVWPRFGNSRDYAATVHAAIQAARPGVRVDSASNEAVIQGAVSLDTYDSVIWILGTESTAGRTFDAVEQARVEQFVAGGGHLMVSGAEVGYDLDGQNNGRTFFRSTLGAGYASDDAGTYQVTAAAGGIFAGLAGFGFSNGNTFASLDGQTYNVAYPDVLTAQAGSAVALAYSGGTGGAAAIQRAGTGGRGSLVVAGFPFETITQAAARSAVMGRVLEFFGVVPDLPITVDAGQTSIDPVTRSGALRLVKRGGGRLVLDQLNAFTGGLVIEAGEVVIRHPGAVGSGIVDVRDGARMTIDCGYDRIDLPGLVLAAGGRIDVGTGGFVIAAGATTSARVREQLLVGRSGGDWSSPSIGIGSAAAGPGSNRGLGFFTQNDGSMLVAFGAPGDLNLDGVIDTTDVAAFLGAGLLNTGRLAEWREGDVNYDGLVDILDVFEILATGLYDRGSYRT